MVGISVGRTLYFEYPFISHAYLDLSAMIVIDNILIVGTIVFLIPFVVFWLECWFAFLPRRVVRLPNTHQDCEVWIVIPAHNESAGIAATIQTLNQTLAPNESVLIVADNCTDNTAAVAREYPCVVIERENPANRGKGFALQFAVQYLEQHHSPSVIVVLDADCRVEDNTVTAISQLALQKNRPVQALNLCEAAEESASLHINSELGFRFKNLIRPLGLSRLGMPCHLMGTGMAIPWNLLDQVNILGNDLTEDMQLGLELAKTRHPAYFYPEVKVLSDLPQQEAGFISQRTRWEQGHLRTSLTQIPVLLTESLKQRRLDLFVLAMDLTVPPFSLLMMLWLSAFVTTLLLAVLGATFIPSLLLGLTGAITGFTLLCGWFKFCRKQIPLRAMFSLPFYMVRKIPIYFSFLFKKGERNWVRTDRISSELSLENSVSEKSTERESKILVTQTEDKEPVSV